MKKKIAIFEIEYHLGFVKTLVELIDFQNYSVSIFTIKSNVVELKEILGNNFKKVKIETPKKNLLGFLYNFYKESKKYDLCFYFTIQSYFFLLPFRYLFFPKCNTILIALRVENYLGNLFHSTQKKNNIISFIKNFFFNLIRFFIIKSSDAVITSGERDVKILKSKHREKNIFEIPYAVSSNKFNFKNKKLLTIGVPGAVDEVRRDYFQILNLFKSLSKFKKEIELILIGSYMSNQQYTVSGIDNYFESLIFEIEKLKKIGFKIKYFKKKLSQKNYDRLIKKSDIMLTCMNFNTYKDHSWTAVYTETILYNKYLITNRKNSPKNIFYLENSFKTHEEFKNLILKFKNNKYKALRINHKKITKYFNRQEYKKKLSLIINKITK